MSVTHRKVSVNVWEPSASLGGLETVNPQQERKPNFCSAPGIHLAPALGTCLVPSELWVHQGKGPEFCGGVSVSSRRALAVEGRGAWGGAWSRECEQLDSEHTTNKPVRFFPAQEESGRQPGAKAPCLNDSAPRLPLAICSSTCI